MPYEIWKNETDAVARRVPIYLVDVAGQPYTGSLSGFTIQYKKPGGSDGTVTITSEGGGRFYYAAGTGDVDTAGAAWMTVTSPGVILPWVDPILIRTEEPSTATILADVVSLLSNMATSLSNEGSIATQLTTVLARLPSALDGGGNMKAGVQTILDGAITASKIADGALTAAKFAASAITSTVLADNAIASAKVADGALTAAKFASGAFAAVGGVVANTVAYGSRTFKGVLKRMDRVNIGKAANLDATTPTFYDEDGTTVVIQATQDTDAGTRATASTANGD